MLKSNTAAEKPKGTATYRYILNHGRSTVNDTTPHSSQHTHNLRAGNQVTTGEGGTVTEFHRNGRLTKQAKSDLGVWNKARFNLGFFHCGKKKKKRQESAGKAPFYGTSANISRSYLNTGNRVQQERRRRDTVHGHGHLGPVTLMTVRVTDLSGRLHLHLTRRSPGRTGDQIISLNHREQSNQTPPTPHKTLPFDLGIVRRAVCYLASCAKSFHLPKSSVVEA